MLPSTFKCRKCFETSVHDSGCSHRLLVWKLMHLSNINVSVSIVFSTLVEPMTRLVSRPCDVRRVAISSPQKGYGLRGSRKSAGTVREKEDATDMAANEQGGRERRRWGFLWGCVDCEGGHGWGCNYRGLGQVAVTDTGSQARLRALYRVGVTGLC